MNIWQIREASTCSDILDLNKIISYLRSNDHHHFTTIFCCISNHMLLHHIDKSTGNLFPPFWTYYSLKPRLLLPKSLKPKQTGEEFASRVRSPRWGLWHWIMPAPPPVPNQKSGLQHCIRLVGGGGGGGVVGYSREFFHEEFDWSFWWYFFYFFSFLAWLGFQRKRQTSFKLVFVLSSASGFAQLSILVKEPSASDLNEHKCTWPQCQEGTKRNTNTSRKNCAGNSSWTGLTACRTLVALWQSLIFRLSGSGFLTTANDKRFTCNASSSSSSLLFCFWIRI